VVACGRAPTAPGCPVHPAAASRSAPQIAANRVLLMVVRRSIGNRGSSGLRRTPSQLQAALATFPPNSRKHTG